MTKLKFGRKNKAKFNRKHNVNKNIPIKSEVNRLKHGIRVLTWKKRGDIIQLLSDNHTILKRGEDGGECYERRQTEIAAETRYSSLRYVASRSIVFYHLQVCPDVWNRHGLSELPNGKGLFAKRMGGLAQFPEGF